MSGPFDASVVIPTYARPERTLRAVRSVLAQSLANVETIVVDDASPEPFAIGGDLVAAGVRVIRLAHNGGPAAARNAGVAASTARIIAFLDSDDFFMPGSLAPRLAAVQADQHDGRPALYGASVWRWSPGGPATLHVPRAAANVALLASGCWYFPGSTAIFTRRTWDRVGPLDASLRRLEDLDWGIRLGRAGGALKILPVVAAVIERSERASPARVDAAAEWLAARFGKHGDYPLRAGELARLKSYLALERASAALGAGRYLDVAVNLAASLARRPRLGLHLDDWWQTRPASTEELAAIEALAALPSS